MPEFPNFNVTYIYIYIIEQILLKFIIINKQFIITIFTFCKTNMTQQYIKFCSISFKFVT